jgi:cobalt-precorrin-6B (C15)-methyltransferase
MWKYTSPGIPDDLFIRGNIPMTKEEIRVLTLAKARLLADATVYDVGAGTGSLTVEMARLVPGGQVFAIEREVEGVNLIKENCRRFGISNVTVLCGRAPEAMDNLPKANVIFIGGSGGELAGILAKARACLKPTGRIVINAVTIETLAAAQHLLAKQGFEDIEIVSLAVTRWPRKGRSHMAEALNPVFIISGNIRSVEDGR